jgi:hypothetical protein
MREKSAEDAGAQRKVRDIDEAGILGSFIVGTTPLQSHSFACLAVAMHPLQPEFLSSIFIPSSHSFSERQKKPKTL